MGGTAPISESLEYVAGATNYACVEERGGFILNHECVLAGSMGIFSILATPFREAGDRS